MLKHINRLHDVTYLALASSHDAPAAFASASEYSARLIPVGWSEPQKFSARFYKDLALNLSSTLPYAIQKYRSPDMKRAIERECAARDYDLVVCDFLTPAINYTHTPARPAVLFQHNVESAIWRRHYETQTNPVKRAFFYSQWQKMERYERSACRAFDAVIAVSRADRDQMRDDYGVSEVYDVPTGVDTEYFRPLGSRPEPYNLVFTGSMDWIPNEDAIIHFAEKILPQIARRLPLVTLTVVGRNPSRRLKAIAEANSRIKITGRVDDVRPFIAAASVYVVPMRVGGGTRLKIYEAMAMAKPVLSTTVGAEGLPVADGRELLIADEPGDFAEAAIRLLSDPQLANGIGRQARSTVCAKFGWERAADRFMEICGEIVDKRHQRRAA
jgi:glycosyltransferase involved in cell wall biosynthesis